MNELTTQQLQQLLQRIPIFELSYETISHKKVPENYDLCIAVPVGKKFFAWITYSDNRNVCYFLELNKEKRIVKGSYIELDCDLRLTLGTIFYGVILEDEKCVVPTYIIEDIIYYEGIAVYYKKCIFKYNLIHNCLLRLQQINMSFNLPILCYKEKEIDYTNDWHIKISNEKKNSINYVIHHFQYRSLNTITPYLNYLIARNFSTSSVKTDVNKTIGLLQWYSPIKNMDFSKPQYKYPTTFIVTADIQYDVYHLFAYGTNKKEVYYNIAYIPNYKTSIFMNSIFRNIKENKNIDYIEESEDEEEFENIKEDKYVDLKKKMIMEFIFNKKFKKWIPVRNLSIMTKNANENHKVIHISKLI